MLRLKGMSTSLHSSLMIPGTRNIDDVERWISMGIGGALVGFALRRRGIPGAISAVAGAALLWRGTTGHCPLYGALGISTAEDQERSVSVPYGRGIRVEKAVTVAASPHRLYTFWRRLENLPKFMRHLESVSDLGNGHSRWVSRGPAGTRAEWEAEIINEVPDQLIGWRSVDGSNVDNAGSVHFDAVPGGTEVRVILRYDPPGGSAGAAFARLFGDDPAIQVEEDLARFRDIAESGATGATGEFGKGGQRDEARA